MELSDLLVSLVKAGTTGDQPGFRMAAEAVIAEERPQRHTTLPDRLANAIQPDGDGMHSLPIPDPVHRGNGFMHQIVPRRRLDDIVLLRTARQGVDLRAHGLEPHLIG